MKKSAYLSDILFAFTVLFLPMLCYLRFRGISLSLSVVLAALCGVCAAAFAALWMNRKYHKQKLTGEQRRQVELFTLHLALLSQREQAEFFAERISALSDTQTVRLLRWDGAYLLQTDDTLIYPLFSVEPISANRVLPLLTHPTEQKCRLISSPLTADAQTFLVKFSLQTSSAEETYLRLKTANALPERYKSESMMQQKRKRRFALWLQKKNARPFFTGGALLLFSSLFSPFPYYYVIVGTLLTFTSVLVRTFGKE